MTDGSRLARSVSSLIALAVTLAFSLALALGAARTVMGIALLIMMRQTSGDSVGTLALEHARRETPAIAPA